ncbi:MAG: pilus assembly protein N-terminal domain-containing protein [Clostridia bacterium]|nr:pilus assembly protein N-terminal domain-containing protein [Clostridia bacterium]
MMNKIRKCFGGIRMTWVKVILSAVITAVYTALINQVPFLNGTSFQDIAVYLECWILFAVFIVVNCNKWWEAALKCFVFFLISQPLIFLIEVPFSADGWGIFSYYRRWFFITLLTLPGGAVAFFVKKKNMLSAAILSVANCILAYQAATYVSFFEDTFPRHLLSLLFCVFLAFFFIFVLLEDKKTRAAASAVFIAVLAALMIFTIVRLNISVTKELTLDEGQWSYSMDDTSIADIEIADGNQVTVTSKKNGYTIIAFTDENGKMKEYSLLVDGKNVTLEIID